MARPSVWTRNAVPEFEDWTNSTFDERWKSLQMSWQALKCSGMKWRTRRITDQGSAVYQCINSWTAIYIEACNGPVPVNWTSGGNHGSFLFFCIIIIFKTNRNNHGVIWLSSLSLSLSLALYVCLCLFLPLQPHLLTSLHLTTTTTTTTHSTTIPTLSHSSSLFFSAEYSYLASR